MTKGFICRSILYTGQLGTMSMSRPDVVSERSSGRSRRSKRDQNGMSLNYGILRVFGPDNRNARGKFLELGGGVCPYFRLLWIRRKPRKFCIR